MDTPSAPSFNLNTKSWHENCRSANFSVRSRQSHFSIPTAARLRRRVEWRSRMGAAWRPPEGLVLDGREHGGRLLLSGGKAIKTVLSAPSESVILLSARRGPKKYGDQPLPVLPRLHPAVLRLQSSRRQG